MQGLEQSQRELDKGEAYSVWLGTKHFSLGLRLPTVRPVWLGPPCSSVVKARKASWRHWVNAGVAVPLLTIAILSLILNMIPINGAECQVLPKTLYPSGVI